MKKLILLIFLLLSNLAYGNECKTCHAGEYIISDQVISHAQKYLYVREKSNNNDFYLIDNWLKNCGLGKGYPYCCAFVTNMYKDTYSEINQKSPYPMYAGVSRLAEYCYKNPLKFKVISSKKVLLNIDSPPQKGDILIWKHGKASFNSFDYKGHTGILEGKDKSIFYTIEGNTKAELYKNSGDQSGSVLGDLRYGKEGVYERKREINIYSNFPIVYFIRSR